MAIPRNLSNLAQGADTSGVLGTSKGGTGLSTVGTAGNVLTSNGSAWVSSAPSGVPVGALQYFSSGAIPNSSWLACNGTIYSDSSYPSLSTAIGNIPNRFTTTQNQVAYVGAGTITSARVVTNGTNYYIAGNWDFCGTPLNYAVTSTNGASWTATGVDSPGRYVIDLQYLNSLFFAIMDNNYSGTIALKTSSDFNSWTTRSTGATDPLRTVRYLNGNYVTAGDSGYLATSTNASTWTPRSTGISTAIYGVAYGNGIYVFVGAGGVCRTSTDLITWTSRTTGTSNNLNNLIFVNNTFYAIGSGVTAISTDGINWTSYTTSNNVGINTVIYGYGDNFYYSVAGGSFGNTYWSKNGINWGIYVAYGNANNLTAKSNELIIPYISGANVVAPTYNPFTYTTSTQFAVPNQSTKSTNQTGVTVDGNFNLYIKAT